MFDAPPADVIIVTGRALREPVSEQSFAVDRVDRSRLRDAPSSQLDEVLKQIPGLQLFRRSDSRSGHPTSQGVTLRALGGNASSRALLVLDGVPQDDPFGGWINWPAYDPASLAQVRVIRGGGSVTYGPGALAGVIDMASAVGEGIYVSADAGSRSSLEGRMLTGMALGGGVLTLSAHGARGDGFIPITDNTRGPVDEAAPYRQASIRSRWIAPLRGDVELQLGGSAFVDKRNRGLDFTGNRTEGADAALRLVGRGRWQWSALAYAQWRDLQSSFASVNAGRMMATRVSLQDSVPSEAVGGAIELRPPMPRILELRVGMDARSASGDSHELFNYVAGEPRRRRRAGGETLHAGAFAEMTAELGRVTFTGGGRLDYWRVDNGELREWEIASDTVLRDEEYASRSGWLPTARAGANFRLDKGWSMRSAAYLGWRMPTLNELFRPFRVGLDATAANPLLDPEKVGGVEAGVKYDRGGITLGLTAFVNRLENAIANVSLGQGPGVFPGVGFVAAGGEFRQRQNLDAIRVRGIEASGSLKRGSWSIYAGASLVRARVDATGSAPALDGLRPAQTPSFVLTGGVGWERGRRAISLQARHVGSQFEDDLNERELASATVFDAFAAWPLTRQMQLVFRGENLLDEVVEAGIGGDGSIERATPRTLWLGARVALPR